MQIWLRRAYQQPGRQDGFRVLVDRIWPRGISREELQLDAWLKEIAPSTALRRWFAHDPLKWGKFQSRYRAELTERPEAQQAVKELARRVRQGRVTLVYGARDTRFNNAVALRNYMQRELAFILPKK